MTSVDRSARPASPTAPTRALIEELLASLEDADNLNAGMVEHVREQLRAILRSTPE